MNTSYLRRDSATCRHWREESDFGDRALGNESAGRMLYRSKNGEKENLVTIHQKMLINLKVPRCSVWADPDTKSNCQII
jgi:hypothetical protein